MKRFLGKKNTVEDTHTSLVWTTNASMTEFPMTWCEAFHYIEDMNKTGLFGFSDWRLPNRRELLSIVSYNTVNPSIAADHPFKNVFPGYYWTSTSCRRLPDQAWYIHMGGARVFKGMKHGSYMVWPVRISGTINDKIFRTGQKQCYNEDGQIIDCTGTGQDGEFQFGIPDQSPRFLEDTDTVQDLYTGLTWSKKVSSMTGWEGAFEFVERMNDESNPGIINWRIPSILELESLTDMGEHSPALPKNHPFTDVEDFFLVFNDKPL